MQRSAGLLVRKRRRSPSRPRSPRRCAAYARACCDGARTARKCASCLSTCVCCENTHAPGNAGLTSLVARRPSSATPARMSSLSPAECSSVAMLCTMVSSCALCPLERPSSDRTILGDYSRHRLCILAPRNVPGPLLLPPQTDRTAWLHADLLRLPAWTRFGPATSSSSSSSSV